MSLLSLEQFRLVMGFHPWHFWCLSSSAHYKLTSACNGLVYEYAWQSADAVGRFEIQEAIDTAEERLIDYLEYSPAPRYQEAILPYPRVNQVQTWRLAPVDGRGRWISVILPEGKIRAIGVETLTDIEDCNLTLSDSDGDGLNDTWSFASTMALGTTSPDELEAYFITGDIPAGEDVDDKKWAIHPVRISITLAGIANVTGKMWQIVLPAKRMNATGALDPAAAANYPTKLRICRRWIDPNGITTSTSQAVLIWETEPLPPFYPGSLSSSDPAATGQVVARAGIRNSEIGEVIPAEVVYDPVSATWSAQSWSQASRPPDRVKVRYSAGVERVSGEMAWSWQKIVARLAAAELGRNICGCQEANRELYTWQFDLSRAAGAADEQYQVSEADLNNPFGTRRGHVYAWKQVKNLALVRGTLI